VIAEHYKKQNKSQQSMDQLIHETKEPFIKKKASAPEAT
jgi:hypothetical protein